MAKLHTFFNEFKQKSGSSEETFEVHLICRGVVLMGEL